MHSASLVFSTEGLRVLISCNGLSEVTGALVTQPSEIHSSRHLYLMPAILSYSLRVGTSRNRPSTVPESEKAVYVLPPGFRICARGEMASAQQSPTHPQTVGKDCLKLGDRIVFKRLTRVFLVWRV